ncbi:MAG: TlpA disulfide reductase family protein [Aliidongia sp.]
MNIKLVLSTVVILLVAAAGAAGYIALHSAPSDASPQDGAMAGFQRAASTGAAVEAAFLDEDGKPTDLSRFKGHVTLVNLWATWCSPCVREMPSLERLRAARENDHFVVATISEDTQGASAVDAFFAKNGLAGLPRYLDPKDALSHAFKINGLPTTLLLDSDGHEIGRFEGEADWDGPAALRLIDQYAGHAG